MGLSGGADFSFSWENGMGAVRRDFTKRLKTLDRGLRARNDDRRESVVIERKDPTSGRFRRVMDVTDEKGRPCAPSGAVMNRLREHDTHNHDVLADLERDEQRREQSHDNSLNDMASSFAREARPAILGRVSIRVGIEWDPKTGKVLPKDTRKK